MVIVVEGKLCAKNELADPRHVATIQQHKDKWTEGWNSCDIGLTFLSVKVKWTDVVNGNMFCDIIFSIRVNATSVAFYNNLIFTMVLFLPISEQCLAVPWQYFLYIYN